MMNLVDATFQTTDTNGDDKIDFAEFEAMVGRQPSILRPLTLNVSELLAASHRDSGAGAGADRPVPPGPENASDSER